MRLLAALWVSLNPIKQHFEGIINVEVLAGSHQRRLLVFNSFHAHDKFAQKLNEREVAMAWLHLVCKLCPDIVL